jgi:NAD(P)H dehydrogenase (quinone)
MANQIARGVISVDGCEARLRTVPELTVAQATDVTNTADATNAAVYVTRDELAAADGLIVGSPTRFGNMAAPLKFFFDSTTDIWLSGALCDKPAAVFTSSSSMHGGQESTLFTMMLPLLHHGMLMVGIPYTQTALEHTRSGGTPYGASQVTGQQDNMTADEKSLCLALGKRVATIASQLQQTG